MKKYRNILDFFSSNTGIAAVEFALVLPILLLLFLGGFELSRFLLIHQKVDRIAYTIADVVTQSTVVTNNQINQILSATIQIMNPFSFTDEGIVILSSVYQSGSNPSTVRWQRSGGGTLSRSSQIGMPSGNATLPVELTLNDKDNVIISEVYYRYTPVLSAGILSPQDIYKTAIFKPRLGALTTPPN